VWYRTADGDYLPEGSVRVPRTPARTFAGRWIDADLREPAMLTAYDGDTPVLTALSIHGTGGRPTPVGLFRIIRRVANETMNSDTIGIPRFGPGGYYLTNVLFTQYFTGDGASLHYNYWSSNWGYAASHGCLGLTYADSAYLWGWASLGTPISVHY
jgi:lipoprotein-anchoring transpeptidase ErfK/SrfK